ncbi:MAG: outer membrane protein assembly factor BamD [Candidatus Babeliales bacterium]
MRARRFLLFHIIFLLTHLSISPITHTPHNQLIKKEEHYTSRLLKKKEEKINLSNTPRIQRKHGRHRRYKKKEKQKKKTFSKMAYEDLEIAKNKQIEDGNNDIAIKYLEQMLKLCDDIYKMAAHLLELGDLLFEGEKFEKSGKIYTEFTMLYPGNDQIEYALYRAILCSFYQTLDADRDQTKTTETIKLIDNFLDRADIFSQYKTEVYQIQSNCYQKLIASEIGICTFYIKRGSYRPAQKRLDGLQQEWLPKIPALESQVILLEITLAEKKGEKEIVEKKQQELQKKYPAETILLAENKKIMPMANRF